MTRKYLYVLLSLCLLLSLCACGAQPAPQASAVSTPAAAREAGAEETATPAVQPPEAQTLPEEEPKLLQLSIAGSAVTVDWEENDAVAALRELCREAPLTVSLSMYGGFEQVGALGTSLPRNDVQMTTAPGDIVLYAGSQIVLFYGSNSWAYTRLGHITDPGAEELAALLGQDDVSITLQIPAEG